MEGARANPGKPGWLTLNDRQKKMKGIQHEEKKPRYTYPFWRGFYLVFAVFFALLALVSTYFCILSFRSGGIPWAESLMLAVSVLGALGQWSRFRNPPRDPIFERE
jgi:hypothetical protein